MANTLNKVLKVAESEKGYMEKSKTAVKNDRSVLNDKTQGAGSDNYTKYWEDLKKEWHGQPWCLCWINWIFKEAYGEKEAKKLLCTDGDWTYYTPTASNYFKKKNQWKTSDPKVGDVIFFKNSVRICHVGLVVKVDSTYVYTIEGNTSSASGVVANGGAVEAKKYKLSYSKIAGYGTPKFDAEVVKEEPKKEESKTTTSSKKETTSKVSTKVKEWQKAAIKDGFKFPVCGADGEWGSECEAVAKKALCKKRKTYKYKNLTKIVQKAVGVTVDGKFGDKTRKAVMTWQKKNGLTADGEVGILSWKVLLGVK